MRITVQYTAQIKQAAGIASEAIDVSEPCTVQDVISRVAQAHGEPLKGLLLNPDGLVQRSILLFVGDDQVRCHKPVKLNDQDVVTILSPISGG